MKLLINIDVDDLDKAVEFYASAIGLHPGRRFFGDTVAEMLGGSSHIYLLAKQPGSLPSAHASQRRDYHRHWTPVHLDFIVDDVWAAVQRALSAGAMLEGEVQCHPWGYLGTMSDPFGHGFCLLQFIGSGYDEVESTAS